MKSYLKIVTINICEEFPGAKSGLLNRWIFILSQVKGDIIFLQEINSYNIERLSDELGLHILNINNKEGTCILINPDKLTIVGKNEVTLFNSNRKPIYVGGLHLDDIPSLIHHLNNKIYKSDEIIPVSTSMTKIIKLCIKNRSPRLKQELAMAEKYDRAIIAGDFNEPSHLDLDNIKVPVSLLLEAYGFKDTFFYANKKDTNKANGFTWPASHMYKDEPGQRIDMIYAKDIKCVRSVIYDGASKFKWISDHKMVISDLEII